MVVRAAVGPTLGQMLVKPALEYNCYDNNCPEKFRWLLDNVQSHR